MSGGVPKKIQISRIQRNTPSKAGNPVPKKAIILCNGRRGRRAMCNYIRKRTNVIFPSDEVLVWTYGPLSDLNFLRAIDWWIEGGKYKSAVQTALGNISNWNTSSITDMQNAFKKGRPSVDFGSLDIPSKPLFSASLREKNL